MVNFHKTSHDYNLCIKKYPEYLKYDNSDTALFFCSVNNIVEAYFSGAIN